MRVQILNTLYQKTISGVPMLGTPADVARRVEGHHNPGDRLITLYTSLSAATGFVCGLPGFLMIPITLPADMIGTAVLQLHMCAAFAVLGGQDPAGPVTRERCVGCLLEKADASGKNTEEEEVASRLGIQVAERGLRLLTEQATKWTVQAVRNATLRKLGIRRLPVVGGVLGAGTDAYMTAHVGRSATATFLETAA